MALLERLHLRCALLLVTSLVLALGCAPPKVREGKLSGEWVALAGSDGARFGTAASPSEATALAIAPGQSPDGCVTDAVLQSQLGPTCDHEAEAKASTAMGGEVPTGNAPTPFEVRWYCDTRTLVRLVLERCPPPNQNAFRPRQIAFTVRPVKS
jgi:hypothetical protein